MKKFLAFLFLCTGISFTASAQNLILLKPNEVYKASTNEEVVVMNKNTFGNYHYTASKYDTLKQEVKRLDSALVSQDSLNTHLTQNYERLLFQKQSEIQAYQESYQRLQSSTNDCIKQQNQLQVNYNKLEIKNRRCKTWRNWFMGTTIGLSTVLILLVTH